MHQHGVTGSRARRWHVMCKSPFLVLEADRLVGKRVGEKVVVEVVHRVHVCGYHDIPTGTVDLGPNAMHPPCTR